MNFKELQEQAQKAISIYTDARSKAIAYACDRLVPVLEKLSDTFSDETIVDRYDPNDIWINLRYIAPLGIRYCGRFINIIAINNDKSIRPIYRLQFLFANYESYDDLCSAQCYPDDTYFGEAADERYDRIGVMPDWENLVSLIKQLEVYFINTSLQKDYEEMERDILDSQEAQAVVATDLNACSVNEEIELFFRDLFKTLDFYNPRNKKHFLKFPEGVSIRYRGKFHNCLVLDDYSLSLGYIQHNHMIQEEGYSQDPYTVSHDFDRYFGSDYSYNLLHELSLTRYPSNDYEFLRALRCLSFIFGEDLERANGSLYLNASSVKYIKTIFTD